MGAGRSKREMSCLSTRENTDSRLEQQPKGPAQGHLRAGVPRTALCISNSLISPVFVSAEDRWSMTARQSEKLPSQGNLVE